MRGSSSGELSTCIAITSPVALGAAWFALAAAAGRSPLPPATLAVGRPEVCGESTRTTTPALDLRYHCRPRCHSVFIAVLALAVFAGTSSSSDEVEAGDAIGLGQGRGKGEKERTHCCLKKRKRRSGGPALWSCHEGVVRMCDSVRLRFFVSSLLRTRFFSGCLVVIISGDITRLM
jgi:hypothetical protein